MKKSAEKAGTPARGEQTFLRSFGSAADFVPCPTV